MRIRFYFLVDEQNLAILADINRPAKWNLALGSHDAIRFGDLLGRIAEDRVIQFERFSKLFVDVFCIAASSKISDLELFDGIATLTE